MIKINCIFIFAIEYMFKDLGHQGTPVKGCSSHLAGGQFWEVTN